MEIEAKFAVPDLETLQRLQAAEHLAGFALSAGRVERVRDTYLDTTERLILAAGYACRQREREQDEGVLITLKGLGGAEDASGSAGNPGLCERGQTRGALPLRLYPPTPRHFRGTWFSAGPRDHPPHSTPYPDPSTGG